MKDIDKLVKQELDLQRQLAEVRSQRAALERTKRRDAKPTESGRPMREMVLDALHEAGAPLNSLLMASVFRPIYGREFASTRFGTLSADEEKSFLSGRPKPVYLCHCLTHDHGQAMKRFWARSDWPMELRIIGPMTGRLLFLRGAAWVIGLAKNHRSTAAQPEKLDYVAADQARDAGLSVVHGHFLYDQWLAKINEQIERYHSQDRGEREAAAAVLAGRLNEKELLFGARPGLTSLPGSTKRWKSGPA